MSFVNTNYTINSNFSDTLDTYTRDLAKIDNISIHNDKNSIQIEINYPNSTYEEKKC